MNADRALPPDHGTTVNMLRALLEHQGELETGIRRYPIEVEVTEPSYYRVVLDCRPGEGPVEEIRRLMTSIPCDSERAPSHV